MIKTLEELAFYIRKTIPNPNAVLNLQAKNSLGAVTFYWHGSEFLVKPTLSVLEIQGSNLYITGLSTLLQSVLLRGNQHERSFDAALTAVNQAEDLIRSKEEHQAAAKLLTSAADILKRLVSRRS